MQSLTSRSLFVDHYAVLGLPCGASIDSIRSSFRRLAHILHPDRSGDDGLQFIRLHSAYRILSNPQTREVYDSQYQTFFSSTDESNDSFEQIIPAARVVFPENIADLARRGLLRKRIPIKLRRHHLRIDYDLELPLYRSELGRRLRVDIPAPAREVCPECMGSDTECFACNGKGSVKKSIIVQLTLAGGLIDGQILDIDLKALRPGRMAHFKKSTLRVRISVIHGVKKVLK